MAKRVFSTQNVLGPLNALGALATTGTYMSVKTTALAAAGLCDVLEVLISGNASSSNIGGFFLCRASALSSGTVTLAAPNSDGLMLASGTALSATIVAATGYGTTQSTISNATTDAKLNLTLNAFGGIIRWNAAPTQQWQLSGTAAPGAETVLSNITGGNAQAGATSNAHILYEPY
jgi:hypothetical protein